MTTINFWKNEELLLAFTIPAGEMIVRPTKGDCYLFGKKAFVVAEIVLNHNIIKDFVDHQMNVYLEAKKIDKRFRHSFEVFKLDNKRISKAVRKAR